MKLEPRKATDRGGWLCMPLVKNGPEGKPGWKKVRCPECGTLCWQRPEDAGVVRLHMACSSSLNFLLSPMSCSPLDGRSNALSLYSFAMALVRISTNSPFPRNQRIQD